MVAAVLTAAGWPLVERFNLRLEQVDLPLPSLPVGLDGLRIGLITDVHVGNYAGPWLAERVTTLMNLARPDLVLLGGDLVHEDVSPGDLQATAITLGRLQAPLGVFAVLGNHDYGAGAERVTSALEDAGIAVLLNQGHRLPVGDPPLRLAGGSSPLPAGGSSPRQAGSSSLWLAGLDDAWIGRPDLAHALNGARGDELRLLLVHEPDYADSPQVRRIGDSIALQLSGHSHGGQVRLPGVGALHLPPLGRRYPLGLQRADDTSMMIYTSRGIGVTGPPVRLFCPPEVSMLTLRSVEA